MKQIKSFVSNKSSRPVDGKAAPRRIVALATERRSQLRKDVLIALIEAGVKGVDTLMNVQRRRYLALEASVPPMVTGNGVRALQSNALKDAFVSETKVTLDAVTCGSVSRHWTVLGSALVVYNRRDRSVLRTDLGANSYRSYMASRRLTIIAFFLVAAIIAFLAITTPLPQLATWLEDRVPPALPLIGHFIIVIIFACFLVITHLSSQKKKRSTGIVVKPTVPRFMVSYSWIGGLKNTARSLARALPDCWLDTRQLVSCDHIPTETTSIATHCQCLLVMLTHEYLNSPNCCGELIAAILFREAYQKSIVVIDPQDFNKNKSLPKVDPRRIGDILRHAGFVVVTSVPELLSYLDVSVLRVEGKSQLAAVVQWWQTHSRPRTLIDSHLQLMAPRQRQKGARCSLCGTVGRTPGTVVAGADYISGDGQRVGRLVRITSQQKALFIALCFAGLLSAYPFLWCIDTSIPANCNRTTAFFWGPTVIVCLIAITTFQIISGLDARALHDPVLLPLNIAAYCNEDKSGSTLLGAFTIKLVRAQSVSPVNRTLLGSLKRFLEDIAVGLPVKEVDLAQLTNDPNNEAFGRAESMAIYVFMLDQPEAARAWADLIANDPDHTRWPPNQIILVATSTVLGTTTNPSIAEHMCIVMGTKEGIDPASPYPSVVKAILDNIGRKVGGVLASKTVEAELAALAVAMQAGDASYYGATEVQEEGLDEPDGADAAEKGQAQPQGQSGSRLTVASSRNVLTSPSQQQQQQSSLPRPSSRNMAVQPSFRQPNPSPRAVSFSLQKGETGTIASARDAPNNGNGNGVASASGVRIMTQGLAASSRTLSTRSVPLPQQPPQLQQPQIGKSFRHSTGNAVTPSSRNLGAVGVTTPSASFSRVRPSSRNVVAPAPVVASFPSHSNGDPRGLRPSPKEDEVVAAEEEQAEGDEESGSPELAEPPPPPPPPPKRVRSAYRAGSRQVMTAPAPAPVSSNGHGNGNASSDDDGGGGGGRGGAAAALQEQEQGQGEDGEEDGGYTRSGSEVGRRSNTGTASEAGSAPGSHASSGRLNKHHHRDVHRSKSRKKAWKGEQDE